MKDRTTILTVIGGFLAGVATFYVFVFILSIIANSDETIVTSPAAVEASDSAKTQVRLYDERFMSRCTEKGESGIFCTCTLAYLHELYSLDGVMLIIDRINHGEDVSAQVLPASRKCSDTYSF